MRLQTASWSINGIKKIGHRHSQEGVNCQDYMTYCAKSLPSDEYYPAREILVGIVSDGCSEGTNSEVGAITLSQFICNEIQHFLEMPNMSPEDLLKYGVFHQACNYVEKQILASVVSRGLFNRMDQLVMYIKNHWLCTVVGFIIINDECWVFSAGDGVIAYDNEVIRISQNNVPHYLAYSVLSKFLPDSVPSEFVPKEFQVQFLGKINRIMIASDGFEDHNKNMLFVRKENDSEKALYGQQWNKHGQYGLQKWVRSCSAKGYFDDDISIVVAEKIDKSSTKG